jgi:putative membrane protein
MRITDRIPVFLHKGALVLLLAGLAGCGSMGGGTAGSARALSGSAAASTGAAMSMSQADQKLMADIAQANIAEIQTGRLALSKSQNPQVRAFAQKMIDDHGMAMQELQTLAQTTGVSLPGDTDLIHKAIAAELGILPGDTFDRQYMSQVGVTDHKRTHELLEQTARTASNPALRSHAQKILPVVARHLDLAQQATGKQ